MNPWTTHDAEYEAVLGRLSAIAEQNGYALNKDRKRVEKVVGLMTENFVSTGDCYCPCKQSHPLNQAADALCPCPTWMEEIGKTGHCSCSLFFKRKEGRKAS